MIDVILATYNGAPFLSEQLESLFRQEGVKLGIRVRDDGSTDGTVSILEKYAQRYPDRITIHRGLDRLGGKGSFAWLLDRSHASYVAFCDQDDVWESHKLRTLLNRMHALEKLHGRETPLMVHSDLAVVDDRLQSIDPSFWRYSGIDPTRVTLGQVLVKNPVTGCALLANRALVEKARPIPDEATMHDHWLALTAVLFGKIDSVYEPLVRYRQHGKNTVGAQAYGWRNVLGRVGSGCEQVTMAVTRLRHQASILGRRFGHEIGPDERTVIVGFSRLSERGCWGKRSFLLRYGVLFPNIWRNMALLICVCANRKP
jgi:glycosyltransferase involved in cell wall biosynthesis